MHFFWQRKSSINRQFSLAMLNNWKVYYIRVSIGPILSFWGLVSLTRSPNMPGMRLWHEWKVSQWFSWNDVIKDTSSGVWRNPFDKIPKLPRPLLPKGGVDQSQAPMLHFHTFPYIFNLDMEATTKKRYVVRPMFGFRPGFLKSRGQVFVGQFPPKGARAMRFGYLLRPSQYQALPKGQLHSLGCLGSWRCIRWIKNINLMWVRQCHKPTIWEW